MISFETTHPRTGDRIHVTAAYRPPRSYSDPETEPEDEFIEIQDVTVGRVSIMRSLEPSDMAVLEAEVRLRWLDQEAGL